jgi:EmrB/QacA subfamily drug resistance transporter
MIQSIRQRSSYKWWALVAVEVGNVTSSLTHSAAIVALPSVAVHYKTDLPTVQWIVLAELLATAALMLPMGRLSDIIGRKQVFMAGLCTFGVGGLLAGTAASINILIIAMLIQGCGAAMIQGMGMALVASLFPANERGKGLGAHMSSMGAGAIVGPALGGLLISAIHWRAVFFIPVPMSILAIAAAILILDGSVFARDTQRPKFDWLGAALCAGTLVALMLGLTYGYRIGWGSPLILASLIGFAILTASFILWELHTPSPMLDLRLFKRSVFSLGVSAGFLTFVGGSSVRFLMPFYLQGVIGYTPLKVGLLMVPMAICAIVLGPISGRLSDRYGWRIFTVGGLAISTIGIFLLAAITENSSLGFVVAGMVLQSGGQSIFFSPNNSSVFSSAANTRYGVVSALVGVTRNSGNVISIAVSAGIVTVTMASMGYASSLDVVGEAPEAFLSGMRRAFIFLGALLFLGMVLSYKRVQRVEKVPAPAAESTGNGS